MFWSVLAELLLPLWGRVAEMPMVLTSVGKENNNKGESALEVCWRALCWFRLCPAERDCVAKTSELAATLVDSLANVIHPGSLTSPAQGGKQVTMRHCSLQMHAIIGRPRPDSQQLRDLQHKQLRHWSADMCPPPPKMVLSLDRYTLHVYHSTCHLLGHIPRPLSGPVWISLMTSLILSRSGRIQYIRASCPFGEGLEP